MSREPAYSLCSVRFAVLREESMKTQKGYVLFPITHLFLEYRLLG